MLYRFTLLTLLLLSLAACSIHKIDIQQGNIVEDQQLEKLHVGMRREQVTRLLGTPMVQDPFRPDRWDYVYYYKAANKPANLYQLTLFFEDEYLIDFVTDIPQRRPNLEATKEESAREL